MESQTPARRRIVVDGSNLATEGRTLPSLAQLNEAIETFLEEYRGFTPEDVTVVVDASFGHRIDPSEVHDFEQAVEHGEMVAPPAGAVGRGDGFILRIAEKSGALVLSNDSFQEFHAERPWLFEPGRLIGGKPVPGVGWVFTPRTPVRGPRSRSVTAKSKRDARTEDGTLDGSSEEFLDVVESGVVEAGAGVGVGAGAGVGAADVGAEAKPKRSRRRRGGRGSRGSGGGGRSGSTDGSNQQETTSGSFDEQFDEEFAAGGSSAPVESDTMDADDAYEDIGRSPAKAARPAKKATKATKAVKAVKATAATKATKAVKAVKATAATKATKAVKAVKATAATKAVKATKTVKATAATKAAKRASQAKKAL